MTSTPRHHAWFGRVLLLAGGLALALVGVASAVHVVCAHDHDEPDASHGCVVCRHLADGVPTLVAAGLAAVPAPVADAVPVLARAMATAAVTCAVIRAPPSHDSMA